MINNVDRSSIALRLLKEFSSQRGDENSWSRDSSDYNSAMLPSPTQDEISVLRESAGAKLALPPNSQRQQTEKGEFSQHSYSSYNPVKAGVDDAEAIYSSIYGDSSFRAFERRLSGLNVYGEDAIYTAQSQTPELTGDVDKTDWQKEIDHALHMTSLLVGTITEYNSQFHQLSKIDISQHHIDPNVARVINNYISDENHTMQHIYDPILAEHALWSLRFNTGMNQFKIDSNGEYKIDPYKMMSKDGKLVLEMKDNGHLVTYNEDGSVLKERSRFEVCAELSDGHDLKWGFGETRFARYSTFTHTDDQHLMFY